MDAATALTLVILHTVDGREAAINPALVTTVTEVRTNDPRFAGKTNCVVTLADAKFLNVTETCDVVRLKLSGARQTQ